MAQETTLTAFDTLTKYIVQSTTNDTTITASDDAFLQILAIQDLTKAVKELSNAVRLLRG